MRKPNGKIHPKAFGGVWERYKDDCVTLAMTHRWTSEQLEEVKAALDALPDRSSLRLWEEVVDNEVREPGFIREKLHRKLKS